MIDDPVQYRARAAEQRAAAAASPLDNVRDRCTRAADAWDAMASRAERTRKLRDEREGRDTAA